MEWEQKAIHIAGQGKKQKDEGTFQCLNLSFIVEWVVALRSIPKNLMLSSVSDI